MLPERFPNLQLDEFIVMPDHFHARLFLNASEIGAEDTEQTTTSVGYSQEMEGRTTTRIAHTQGKAERSTPRVAHTEDTSESEIKIVIPKLGQIIGAFKSITTNRYINGIKYKGWEAFDKQIWHRNYHDRIIRNGKELKNIRKYIRNNPFQWKKEN
ncbi:MAG: hypothetical protein FVQ83_01375 [Chloroflexi bacterium]|nr:hypothetical protein [Chloroflexota bacterium]